MVAGPMTSKGMIGRQMTTGPVGNRVAMHPSADMTNVGVACSVESTETVAQMHSAEVSSASPEMHSATAEVHSATPEMPTTAAKMAAAATTTMAATATAAAMGGKRLVAHQSKHRGDENANGATNGSLEHDTTPKWPKVGENPAGDTPPVENDHAVLWVAAAL
jgi:hypothetical protein